ncbi:MAG: carbohydrate ABC transporter permease [Clostridia bacterium]|nr:carbohydrate ABC transporter permease [Clostridia bacterium]MBQ3058229.1 carbohydrate ABC transporter permease [Clostridia bacterium]
MSNNSSLQVMQERDMHKVVVAQKIMRVVSQFFLYLFLFAVAFVILFPFYWMLISSVKTLDEYMLAIPTLFPREFDFVNYVEAFNTANLGRLFGNTVFVGVVSTILSLVITVLSAFAFARLEFKGKNAMFAALLATMMIPGELFTITNYKTVNDLGWLNLEKYGFTVLIVPFLVSVFYIYLLKQNFMQIPNELYLAAKVDGTSDLKYLWKVMIPLALPTLISITILKMMGSWNTYMWPNLVADSQNYWLVTNGLRKFSVTVDNRPDTPVQMAAVAIVSAPLFMVFLFLRKYIMKGVSRSGIKG